MPPHSNKSEEKNIVPAWMDEDWITPRFDPQTRELMNSKKTVSVLWTVYTNSDVYTNRAKTSTEPCPMRFIRLLGKEFVNTKTILRKVYEGEYSINTTDWIAYRED